MTKIRASGGYRKLRSFQISTVIYDATYWFCERFLDPRSCTCDQMRQAARSGRGANARICLIHQANYLLDHQIEALERGFIKEGGYSEQLAAERLAFRAKKTRSDPTDPTDLTNSSCGTRQ